MDNHTRRNYHDDDGVDVNIDDGVDDGSDDVEIEMENLTSNTKAGSIPQQIQQQHQNHRRRNCRNGLLLSITSVLIFVFVIKMTSSGDVSLAINPSSSIVTKKNESSVDIDAKVDVSDDDNKTIVGESSSINDDEVSISSDEILSETTTTETELFGLMNQENEIATSYNLPTALAAQQVMNYRNRTGLMVNIHITHHAGTTFCGFMKRVEGPVVNGTTTPSFACMGPISEFPPQGNNPHPWNGPETTATSIQALRPVYHMVSWEYARHPNTPLQNTDWENQQLLSVYIGRDPMSRMLAGDGNANRWFPNVVKYGNATEDDLWEFANHKYTDNYNLHVLTNHDVSHCCYDVEQNRTDEEHYTTALSLLQRFSIILDQECLSDGLLAVADLLGLEIPPGTIRAARSHATPRERIGNDDVYKFLEHKNEMDNKLYNWVKSHSLVDCSKIPKE